MAETVPAIPSADEAPVPPVAAEPGDGYQVRLDVFEGPLDLLLFLIRKKKIDIHDIPIAAITRDYLGYLERKTEINLDREAEFLFIAALLIYIKSQMLLPRETDLAEGEDPRRVLVDRLVELGKTFDYMSYPNRDHGLREGKGTPVHLRMVMLRYLLDHLPAGPR